MNTVKRAQRSYDPGTAQAPGSMRALHCKTVCAASRAKESRRTDALFVDPLAEKLALPPQGQRATSAALAATLG